MSYLWGTTELHFYQNYQEGTFGTRHVFNRPDIYWEAESLSSLSERSCDQDGPCCTCDCDCQPAIVDNTPPGGYFRIYQNNSGTFYDTNLQSHGAGQEPQSRFYTRNQTNTRPSHMTEPRFLYEKQDVPSAEDMIYNNAKQQRLLKDAQRKIQDWMRIMPELVGSDMTTSPTYHKSKGCSGRSNKEYLKGEVREGKKEKRRGHGRKKSKRGMSERRFKGGD
ncbi:hypothetical protein IL306_002070 [Fusarium sp. DS 682]|nr:hypothetical protein IL306_002070 [Fusarium sp. DS 682]